MRSKTTILIALFVAVAFGSSIPVFAEQSTTTSPTTSSPSMGSSDESGAQKDEKKKMKRLSRSKKKGMGHKSKKPSKPAEENAS